MLHQGVSIAIEGDGRVFVSEFLSENVILQSDPHLLCSRIIIAHLDIIARQRAFGDMKDTVKM